jgi:ATP/ADP translocase
VNTYSHLVRLFGPGQREKGVVVLAPAFALGGLLGSILAAQSAPWLMHTMGWRYEVVRDNLMLAMAACLLAQIPVVHAIERRAIAGVATIRSVRASLTSARPGAAGRPIVWKLAAVIALGGVADTLLKYLFYWLVSLQVDSSHGRTLYFAAFYSWLNGANLVLLLAGTGRAIRRLGLALAVASLPIAMAAGAAALTMHVVMTVMYGLRVAENSMRSLLYEPALDRALARIPPDAADRGRALLKAIAPRGGEGLGALLVLGLGSWAGFDPTTAAATLLAVAIAWLGTALVLKPALREGAGD